MPRPERNRQILVRLFENLGPGLEYWKTAYREALTADVTWYMQGWPHVIGMEELDAQLDVLHAMLGVEANPILEWRGIDAYDDRVYFERRGSFADGDGATITCWDIFGVFEFDESGMIHRIRDYFDSTAVYDRLHELVSPEQIAMIRQAAAHPLTPDYVASPTFYRGLREQLSTLGADRRESARLAEAKRI